MTVAEEMTTAALDAMPAEASAADPQPIFVGGTELRAAEGVGIRTFWARIGPEEALSILLERAPNRAVRPAVVRAYLRQMENGQWQTTHQGIAFDDAGHLRDGQHRLIAVCESGIAITVLVSVGLSDRAFRAMDLGAKRSTADVLGISKTYAAVANSLAGLVGNYSVNLTPPEIQDTLEEHAEAIALAVESLASGPPKIAVASVLAQVAAAYLAGEDGDRLREFCHVLKTGVPEDSTDRAALALYRYLNDQKVAPRRGDSAELRKVQRAIKAFCDRESLDKLRSPKDWIYPLPTHPAIRNRNESKGVGAKLTTLEYLKEKGLV